MPFPAGTRLGPYEVVGLIGAGGMGEVYRALRGGTGVARQSQRPLRLAETRYVQPSVMGLFCANLGRTDEAFTWFDRACEAHDLLPVLNYFAAGHTLALDPRWPALMRRIGLVPASERGFFPIGR
ncbi:MAG TPA: hypothetical protein VMM93_03790 [Vicinamibacterales bacterium]|nr:hypothetical protein [Vicinamibacterales bacterium]